MNHSKILNYSCLLVLAYIAVYVIDSVCGGYWPKPVIGSTRYANTGLGIPTLVLWQPRFGYRDSTYSTSLGYFFSPMIYFDRLLVHRSLDLDRKDDEKTIFYGSVKWHHREEAGKQP